MDCFVFKERLFELRSQVLDRLRHIQSINRVEHRLSQTLCNDFLLELSSDQRVQLFLLLFIYLRFHLVLYTLHEVIDCWVPTFFAFVPLFLLFLENSKSLVSFSFQSGFILFHFVCLGFRSERQFVFIDWMSANYAFWLIGAQHTSLRLWKNLLLHFFDIKH